MSNEKQYEMFSEDTILSQVVQLVQHGSDVYGYVLRGRQGIFSEAMAKCYGIPEKVTDVPEFMIEKEYVAPESISIWRKFFKLIDEGKSNGSAIVNLRLSSGKINRYRLHYSSFTSENGIPCFALIFVEDISSVCEQTCPQLQPNCELTASDNIDKKQDEQEQLQEQLWLRSEEIRTTNEMIKQLKENEQILRITAQHTDRIICHYDITKGKAQVWSKNACKKCQLSHLCEKSLESILQDGSILPDCIDSMRNMFRDMQNGVPEGMTKIRVRMPDGQIKRLDMRYTTIFGDENVPLYAMISHKDITEQYEHELAYLRHVQSLKESKNHLGVLEIDLDLNMVEVFGGRMFQNAIITEATKADVFAQQIVISKMLENEYQEGKQFFSSEYLYSQYVSGIRQLERIWQIKFEKDTFGWVCIDVDLLSDPYNGHIKAFFHMTDITEKMVSQLEMQNRSERDGMTGLLNRTSAEMKICKFIAEEECGGIMLLLDLDDLKGINDSLGHREGDRAILGIAETLKSHFRESDVISRLGGDEFLVYLPRAAENKDAIAASVSNLLRKLTGIPIGPANERRIHCSIGCSIQTKDIHSFEVLYKQADVALYHVKRNGKNNYAFYSQDMMQEDYQFQTQSVLSLQCEKNFELKELEYLLSAISDFYQFVLSANLTTNSYFFMEEVFDERCSKMPIQGFLSDFLDGIIKYIEPVDAVDFMKHLSREVLLKTYERGGSNVRHYFRLLKGDAYAWVEASVIFYTNEKGDVCAFILLRWADERSNELELMWLEKLLELAVATSFEYVCLVNVESREYTLYEDKSNTCIIPKQGNFDEVTREIRDQFILPKEREAYYEKANLEHVLIQMENEGGEYSFCYHMQDGEREAVFHWFGETHSHLLMTVRKR